jgi:hypothetical protein
MATPIRFAVTFLFARDPRGARSICELDPRSLELRSLFGVHARAYLRPGAAYRLLQRLRRTGTNPSSSDLARTGAATLFRFRVPRATPCGAPGDRRATFHLSHLETPHMVPPQRGLPRCDACRVRAAGEDRSPRTTTSETRREFEGPSEGCVPQKPLDFGSAHAGRTLTNMPFLGYPSDIRCRQCDRKRGRRPTRPAGPA